MKILGIETSCDETGAAVVEKQGDDLKLLSNITATSAGIHAQTGGVIPEDAARKQIQSIIPVIELALKEANITYKEIDAIALTYGPGLIGSLLVGVETAKTLSYIWDKPIVPVNHLVGHIYANFFCHSGTPPSGVIESPKFPIIALVVSGGHSDLVYMEDHGKIKYLGGTRDDAAGEAFDKTARLLGLPYPGGPNLGKIAQEFIDQNPSVQLKGFTRPIINEDNFDFSFSGLKTAVLNYTKKLVENSEGLKLSSYEIISNSPEVVKQKNKIAAEVQEAIVDSLLAKSLKAIEKYKPESFLLAGGVAANLRLREKFVNALTKAGTTYLSAARMVHGSGKLPRTKLYVPEVRLCTDNAAYIAAAAAFNYHPIPWEDIDANPELTITD